MADEVVLREVTNLVSSASAMRLYPDAAMLYCRKALECIVHNKYNEIFGDFPTRNDVGHFSSVSSIMKKIQPELTGQTIHTLHSINHQAKSSIHWSKESRGGTEGKFHHVIAVISQIRAVFIDLYGMEIPEVEPVHSQSDLSTEIVNQTITDITSMVSDQHEPDIDELNFVELTSDAAEEALQSGMHISPQKELQIGKLAATAGEYERAITHLEQAAFRLKSTFDWKEMIDAKLELASVHRTLGDNGLARNLAEECLDLAQSRNLHHSIAESYKMLGNTFRNSETDDAIKHYKNALKIYSSIGDEQGQGAIYHNLGLIHHHQGSFEIAEDLYNRSYQIDKNSNNLMGQSSSLNQLGMLERDRDNIDLAMNLFEQAMDLAMRLNYRNGVARAHSNLANACEATGDIDAAIYHQNESTNIRTEIGLIKLARKGKHKLARYLRKEGRYKEALDELEGLLQDSEQFTEDEALLKHLSQVYTEIGTVHARLEDYNMALKSYQTALEIDEKLSELNWQMYDYRQIGRMQLFGLKDYDSACTAFSKALELAMGLNDSEEIAAALSYLGDVEYGRDKHKLAKQHYTACLGVIEGSDGGGNLDHITITLIDLASCATRLDEFKESNAYLDRAIQICQRQGFAKHERKATYILAWNHHQTENYETAESLLRKTVELFNHSQTNLPNWFIEQGYTDHTADWDYPKQDC